MFDPDKILKIVETIRLKTEFQTEAGTRTAINRSYFSSMLKAKLRLEELGNTLPGDDEIHKTLIEQIKSKNSKMGDKLFALYELRIKADYDTNEEMESAAITSAYGIAKNFNGKINSLTN